MLVSHDWHRDDRIVSKEIINRMIRTLMDILRILLQSKGNIREPLFKQSLQPAVIYFDYLITLSSLVILNLIS
jgi:hypothetical protein